MHQESIKVGRGIEYTKEKEKKGVWGWVKAEINVSKTRKTIDSLVN